jgi:hypothetical protein
MSQLLSQRLAIYRRLPTRRVPALASPARDRLLKKCVSVIKVNTLAPEGPDRQTWSTPDRVPHRHMWLWDSVFHSFGMNHLDPRVAWQFLQSVLERQQPDGMIPHVMQVDGRVSEITQPPILAWGVWQNYQLTHDFSTFQALEMGYVARIAWELGESDRAAHWQEWASATAQTIHQGLWHPGDGFYYDRDFSGRFTGVKAVSGFLPLLLDDIPPSHVDRLAAHLDDPTTFAAPFPVPSVALDHPTWSTDMWRGATWINMNYLIVIGLRKHGRLAEADRLAQATVNHVAKYYQQFGVIFEFYDARGMIPPTQCHRKGPMPQRYDIRAKMSSIRDYHWTAALVASLLLKTPTPRRSFASTGAWITLKSTS